MNKGVQSLDRQENHKKIENREKNCIVEVIVSLFFIVFAIAIFVSKSFFQFQLLPNKFAYFTVAISLIVVVLLFRFNGFVLEKINKIISAIRKISYFKLFITFIVVTIVFRIIFILLLNITSINDNSDTDVYATASYELAKYGKVITNAEYCNYASYSFWHAVFMLPASLLFGRSQIAFSVYFTIILTIAYSLLFDTVSYVFSKTKAFVIFMLFAVSPSQILLVQYINHEHTFLFFLAISVWLYFRVLPCVKSKGIQYLLYFCFFISLALCKNVNPGALLLLFVYALVFLISAIKKHSLREWISSGIKLVSMLLAVIIVSSLLTVIMSNFCDSTKTRKVSGGFMWTFYVGANYETSGEYTDGDANTWFEDEKAKNPETEKDYHNNLLTNRYKDLISQPLKFIRHYTNKFNIIWQQFWYPIARASGFIPDNSTKEMFNHYLYTPFMYLEYFISYVVSIILLWSVILFRKQKKPMFYVFVQLFLMGYTAMLFLTELGYRYTIMVFPFFYIAAFVLINTNAIKKDKTKNIIEKG